MSNLRPQVTPDLEELRPLAQDIVQRRAEIPQIVQDIARLLQVTEANEATVREQPWYKRIWATVTRTNMRLADMGQANLREVQAHSFRLLYVLAEMDELAARSIACLQQQVRVLTWSSVETKGQLAELVTRCANRFADHERRILNVEADTRLLRWVCARFDEREQVRYDDIPVPKRLVLMIMRFVELTGDHCTEHDVHTLLNAIEATGVRLDEAVSLRRFVTDFRQEDLVLGGVEDFDPTVAGLARTELAAAVAPLHALLELQGTPATGTTFEATVERLRTQDVDLDAEIANGDLARLLVDEFKLRRLTSAADGPGQVARRARNRPEYWHRKVERNDLQQETQERAEALLRADARDEATLNSIIELYDSASKEIEGRQLDQHLLRRIADISLHLPVATIPADRLVQHAKRLFQYGSSQAAYEWHAQLVDAAPNHAELRNNLGFILLFRGDIAEARRSLERATELGFGADVHWINRGVADALLGDLGSAESHLRMAVEHAKGEVAAEVVLLSNDAAAGDLSSSRVVLTAGSARAIARCNLGYVLHKMGAEGASIVFDEAVHEEKKLSFTLRAAGWFYHSLSQHRRARLFFGQARQREPHHPMNDWEVEVLPRYYFFQGGRNDPCCCGSGEKFKSCCEKLLE
jgi:tetratricopeptide (TPR) repeat protein